MNGFVMPIWLYMANLSKVSVVPAKAGTQFVPQNLALYSRWSDSGFRRNDDAKFSRLMTSPLAFMQSPCAETSAGLRAW